MHKHTYSKNLCPKKLWAVSYYDTQVPNKSCTDQISDAAWRQKEVVWYHDMLNLNFNLEILINLVNLDLSWKLMHIVSGCF
jgi:hypothetical protein